MQCLLYGLGARGGTACPTAHEYMGTNQFHSLSLPCKLFLFFVKPCYNQILHYSSVQNMLGNQTFYILGCYAPIGNTFFPGAFNINQWFPFTHSDTARLGY